MIAVGAVGSAVKPGLLGSGPAGTLDRVIYLALLGFPLATTLLAWSPSARRRRRE